MPGTGNSSEEPLGWRLKARMWEPAGTSAGALGPAGAIGYTLRMGRPRILGGSDATTRLKVVSGPHFAHRVEK